MTRPRARTCRHGRFRMLRPRWRRLVAVAVDDPAPSEVVGRELDPDAVTRSDPDEVTAHPARRVGDQLVPVLELHLEHRVGQRLGYGGVHDDGFLFGGFAVVARVPARPRGPAGAAARS